MTTNAQAALIAAATWEASRSSWANRSSADVLDTAKRWATHLDRQDAAQEATSAPQDDEPAEGDYMGECRHCRHRVWLRGGKLVGLRGDSYHRASGIVDPYPDGPHVLCHPPGIRLGTRPTGR